MKMAEQTLLEKSLKYFEDFQNIPYNVLANGFRPIVISDLHVSDKPSRVHVDYMRDCIEHLTEITELIRDNNITHVFLLGDLIGRTTERNLQSRGTLMYMMVVLQTWNALTNNQVYSVRGNHDYSTHLTDFEMFVSLGLVRNPSHVDVGSVRFHLVNYGEQERSLDIHPEFYNVALTHTELHVAGMTPWILRSKEAVDIETLDNFYGIDFIIGGHIHIPSPKVVSTYIKDREISLVYPGCKLFTAYERNPWTSTYAIYFDTDENDVKMGQFEFKIRPHDELFNPRKSSNEEEEEDDVLSGAPVLDIAQLSEILSELTQYNLIGDGDYKSQIKRLGGMDKEGVELALQYIEQVEQDFSRK